MEVLTEFLARTAETNERYLWTDSFALLALEHVGAHDEAVKLRDLVIASLGQAGPNGRFEMGLRIGKPQAERAAHDPFMADEEWSRDGQYFHCLTKWAWAMQAMGNVEEAQQMMTQVTPRFVGPDGKLCWKMSVDLSRAQVAISGQHDAVDGAVTILALGLKSDSEAFQSLKSALANVKLSTMDELGIGVLLMDAARSLNLQDESWHLRLFQAARHCVQMYLNIKSKSTFSQVSEKRVAFRELGMAVGAGMCKQAGLEIPGAEKLAHSIMTFWADKKNRDNATYKEHLNINEVMRAAATIFTQ